MVKGKRKRNEQFLHYEFHAVREILLHAFRLLHVQHYATIPLPVTSAPAMMIAGHRYWWIIYSFVFVSDDGVMVNPWILNHNVVGVNTHSEYSSLISGVGMQWAPGEPHDSHLNIFVCSQKISSWYMYWNLFFCYILIRRFSNYIIFKNLMQCFYVLLSPQKPKKINFYWQSSLKNRLPIFQLCPTQFASPKIFTNHEYSKLTISILSRETSALLKII